MKIISHRGYWKNDHEKNTESAFCRSFDLGFGTETDVRDCNQNLVISHDMASGSEMDLASFLSLANEFDTPLTFALNVKADGLAFSLKKALGPYPNLDCFVFDMAVPDMRSYFDVEIRVFTRMSEVEKQPAWLDLSTGVWLDSFESEWFDVSIVQDLLNNGKRVCIVSPELHRRSYELLWQKLKLLAGEKDLMLCTDIPEKAEDFFLNDRS